MKLNNKGLTLIELLAVIVILAVIIGIARISVISAINRSKASTLETTATSVAKAFEKKYMASLLSGEPTNVFETDDFAGYNFSKIKMRFNWGNFKDKDAFGNVLTDEAKYTSCDNFYSAVSGGFNYCFWYIFPRTKDELDISTDSYKLITESQESVIVDNKAVPRAVDMNYNTTKGENVPNDVANSFVAFNIKTGKFTVCMFAKQKENIYVSSYVYPNTTDSNPFKINDNSSDIKAVATKNSMFACSNGVNSWDN